MGQTTLDVTATVTPDGGSPFDIQDQGVYHLVMDSVAVGAQSWRRITVDSNYVPGRSLVHAVMDVQIGAMSVRVFGTDLDDLETNIDALIAQFTGWNYEVSIDFDGFLTVWTQCEPADISVGSAGDNLSGPHLMSYQQSVSLQIPHYPLWVP